MRIGYTLMTEQSGPKELVRYATYAEDAGFDFAVMSDHYFPWLEEQGHSRYAWSMLGAVAQATDRIDLMTYVTCPIMRYHPAVVAQKAATVQILVRRPVHPRPRRGREPQRARRRPRLAAGERPARDARGGDRRSSTSSSTAGYVNRAGEHFRVDSAKLWDLPDQRVPIATAVSGDQSVQKFAPLSDHLVAVEPQAELVRRVEAGPGRAATARSGRCRSAGVPTRTPRAGRARAVPLVRRRLEGQRRASGPGRLRRSHPVRPPRRTWPTRSPAAPTSTPIVEAAKQWKDAGFTDLAFVQIGDEPQEELVRWAEKDLLPALREI